MKPKNAGKIRSFSNIQMNQIQFWHHFKENIKERKGSKFRFPETIACQISSVTLHYSDVLDLILATLQG